MTRPAVSATAETLYSELGGWSLFDGEDTDWLLLHLCEALVGPGRLDDINQLSRDRISDPGVGDDNPDDGTIGGLPIGQDAIGDGSNLNRHRAPEPIPGWSDLVDIDRCPDNAVAWLGQMGGTHIDPDASAFDARALVRSTPGWRRGKLDSIVAAIKLYLQPPKLIEVHERDTSPYHGTIRVYADQVVGATYTELEIEYPTVAAFEAAFARYSDIPSTGRLRQRVMRVKPGGVIIGIQIAKRASYRAIERMYPTIPAFEAALPTYAACANYRPPVDIFTIGA